VAAGTPRPGRRVPTTSLRPATRYRYIHTRYILSGLYDAEVSSVKPPEPQLTQAGFLVLLALASREAHGYAVMQFADQTTGGMVRLPPGTLYRTISRLLADGLVEEIAGQDPGAPHDARRRYYRLTERGRRAAEDEAQLLALLTQAASEAGLARSRRRT
jgi:DNA-binding PadR family transcriptional regulator